LLQFRDIFHRDIARGRIMGPSFRRTCIIGRLLLLSLLILLSRGGIFVDQLLSRILKRVADEILQVLLRLGSFSDIFVLSEFLVVRFSHLNCVLDFT
jgi:hypothetical protein